jgi:Zn-dependent protease with chaperone function
LSASSELESSEPVQDEKEGDVVYLSEVFDGEMNGGKKYAGKLIGVIYIYGIPIMCIALAITGHYRVVFMIGAILGVQLAYIQFRSKRFSGPMIDDPVTRSRISPPLKELCAAAEIAVPRVCVRRSVVPAAMMLQNKRPTLWLSPDFLQVADDTALRAIIAHEVNHLQKGDLAAAQKRRTATALILMVAWLIIFFGTGTNSWIAIAILYAFVMPTMRLITTLMGFFWRKRETRADLEGAEATNDPEAMIRGLRQAYGLGPAIRKKVFGPSAFRWILFPYSLPSTIHPSLDDRVPRLREIQS